MTNTAPRLLMHTAATGNVENGANNLQWEEQVNWETTMQHDYRRKYVDVRRRNQENAQGRGQNEIYSAPPGQTCDRLLRLIVPRIIRPAFVFM